MENTKPVINEAAKAILARLLAQENITVEHSTTTDTAHFEPKHRRLTLPNWSNIDQHVYSMLVGHEVGHALWTKPEEWYTTVFKPGEEFRKEIFKGYLNIVEDIRIERKIKAMYPGLKRDFILGYQTLVKGNFFRLDSTNTSHLPFIDRLNIYTKVGTALPVKFSLEEQAWVKRATNTETWEDVAQLAKDMYRWQREVAPIKFSIEKEDREEEEIQISNSPNEDIDDDIENEYGDKEEKKDDKTEVLFDDSNAELTEDAPPPLTNETMNQAVKETYIQASGTVPIYIKLPQIIPHDDYVIRYQDVLAELASMFNDPEGTSMRWRADVVDEDGKQIVKDSIDKTATINQRKAAHKMKVQRGHEVAYTREEIAKTYHKFCIENSSIVSYLVQEFEAKKAASLYSRSKTARTGTLNMTKLSNYKFLDDIFKKITKTPEAKNHALLMYVDLSGSMSEHIEGTIQQLINLVMFCRRCNIPHRVFGFTDMGRGTLELQNKYPDMKAKFDRRKKYVGIDGEIAVGAHHDDVWLIEFFNNKQRPFEFNQMAAYLISVYTPRMTRPGFPNRYRRPAMAYGMFGLGSTPLNEAIFLARYQIPEFRQQTGAEVVNVIFLTDGDATSDMVYSHDWPDFPHGRCHLDNYGNYQCDESGHISPRAVDKNNMPLVPNYILQDNRTKIEIKLFRGSRYSYDETQYTDSLVRMLRQTCGVHTLTFFVASGVDATRKMRRMSVYAEQYIHAWRRDRYVAIPGGMGCDEFYIISGGTSLRTEDHSMLLLKEGAKITEITRAFKKACGAKLKNRVILSRFINMIA